LRNNIEYWEAVKPPKKTVRKRSNLNGHALPVRGTGKLRCRVRPAPDIGQGKASLRFGPIEFKADGKGAAGALSVGIVGSAGLVAMTAYCGLPVAAVVTMGTLPMLLAMTLILVSLLRS
jgi:hypothetical protein